MAQSILDPVRVTSIGPISLSATGTRIIDSVTLSTNDRVLVIAQSDKVQNGIYTVGSDGALSRAADLPNSATTPNPVIVFVKEGTINADTGWLLVENTFTIGTTALNFKRFTVNQNVAGLPTSAIDEIVLRRNKAIPLTNDELDNNFVFLANSIDDKVKSEDYTAAKIVTKIKTELTVAQADLNVQRLQNYQPAENGVSRIVVADSNNHVTATKFIGNLEGNASSATDATNAVNATNLTTILPINKGGTGATTAADAAVNLGFVKTAGNSSVSGKLSLSNSGAAPLNISSSNPTSPAEGDVWVLDGGIRYRLSGEVYNVARLESPIFTGAPTSPTPASGDNSSKIATTEFVQIVRTSLQNSINLKADSSNTYTKTEADNKFLAKIDSYNKTETDNKFLTIANAVTTYYNKPQIDATLTAYLTSATASNTYLTTSAAASTYLTISNAASTYDSIASVNGKLNSYATITYVDGLQPKWGSSKKFVQSTEPTVGVSNGDFWFKTAS